LLRAGKPCFTWTTGEKAAMTFCLSLCGENGEDEAISSIPMPQKVEARMYENDVSVKQKSVLVGISSFLCMSLSPGTVGSKPLRRMHVFAIKLA